MTQRDANGRSSQMLLSHALRTTVTEYCTAKRLLLSHVASTWNFHLLNTRLSCCTRTPRTLRLRKALPQTVTTMIGASFPLLLYYPPNAAGVPASPKWPRLAEVTTKIRENKMARRPEWNLWKYTAGVPVPVTERPKANVLPLASWNCRFESRRRHVSLLWVLYFFR